MTLTTSTIARSASQLLLRRIESCSSRTGRANRRPREVADPLAWPENLSRWICPDAPPSELVAVHELDVVGDVRPGYADRVGLARLDVPAVRVDADAVGGSVGAGERRGVDRQVLTPGADCDLAARKLDVLALDGPARVRQGTPVVRV